MKKQSYNTKRDFVIIFHGDQTHFFQAWCPMGDLALQLSSVQMNYKRGCIIVRISRIYPCVTNETYMFLDFYLYFKAN